MDAELAKRADGSVDLAASYQIAGKAMAAGGAAQTATRAKWTAVTTTDGHVDFDRSLGRHESAVAFAYAELDSVHAREAVFTCGSDDGIKVWLNGQVVHENEASRGYRPADDRFVARLNAGRNRIVVKIVNYVGGWGFGLGAVPANF